MANILEVDQLCKTYLSPFLRKKIPALSNLSFNIEKGSIVGFLGANGAGKTTALKIIMGLIFADSGHVKIFGKSLNDPGVKEQLGFLTERPYFYDYLTGEEFLKFCAGLFAIENPSGRVKDLLDLVGLGHAANRPLRNYSKGMLQRIGIAQAMINRPKLLILDEPMSGLDPDGRADICRIIQNAQADGATVLFSTHLLHDVETLCDRAVIINRGRLVSESKVSDLLEKYTGGYRVSYKDAGKTGEEKVGTSSELQILIDKLRSQKKSVESVVLVRPSLEEVFLKLKQRDNENNPISS